MTSRWRVDGDGHHIIDEAGNVLGMFSSSTDARAYVEAHNAGGEVTEAEVLIALREYVGGERYARDYEYCNAQLAPKMRKALRAALAARRTKVMPKLRDATPISISYTNWRGETSVRRIVPLAAPHYGDSDYHSGTQWLLRAFDVGKQEEREFALSGFADARACVEAHNAGVEERLQCITCGNSSLPYSSGRQTKCPTCKGEPLYATPQPAADAWVRTAFDRVLPNASPAAPANAVEIVERLREALTRIAEATPASTNSGTADQMRSWCKAVALCALTETSPTARRVATPDTWPKNCRCAISGNCCWPECPEGPGASPAAHVDAVEIVERLRNEWTLQVHKTPVSRMFQNMAKAADEILAALRSEAR